MDELNLTEIRLLTDNRDTLCEELCKCVVEIRNSVNCSDRSCLLYTSDAADE